MIRGIDAKVGEEGSRPMLMSAAAPLVLIVDDEKDLRSLLDFNLRKAGYRTVQASTGSEALARAATHQPDLILLDLNLPDLPGTDVCRQLKTDPATEGIPIVMLTARSGEEDRIRGFELGAEDYVPKPFSVRELILRLEVVRRHTQAVERKESTSDRLLRAGSIELEPDSYVVRVEGKPVTLALLEFRLLQFLMEGDGKVRTREELLRRVWDYPLDSDTRTIETHVKRLRRKLGEAGDRIETVRSVGYRMRTN
jgi:two-component system, OmpR family, phosphate regulon response regulator PhoB